MFFLKKNWYFQFGVFFLFFIFFLQNKAPLVTPPLNFTNLLQSDNSVNYPVLFGLRVNTDLLTAIANVTAQLYTELDNKLEVLDSNITYGMRLAAPEFRGRSKN